MMLMNIIKSFTSLLADNKESISSIKITEGCLIVAMANKVLTIFSPSPTHLLVSELADIEKKVEFDSLAIAFPFLFSVYWYYFYLPIIVFPVPGGPNKRRPFLYSENSNY